MRLFLSLSKALAGCSVINKSWYRDTVVPFQRFLQLISIIKSSRFESAAAKDTFIECGMGKGMRSSLFSFFCCDHHNVVMEVNIYSCFFMIIVLFCSRLQTRCDLKHCFLLMAWVLSNSLLWLCILLSDRSCFSFCTAEFKWRTTFPKWELGVNIQERCCCFLLFPHFGLVPIHSKNILSTEFRHRILSCKT